MSLAGFVTDKLRTRPPRSLLVIGPPLPSQPAAGDVVTLADPTLQDLPAKRFDVAVVQLQALRQRPREDVIRLLGRLRDLHARTLLVLVPAELAGDWPETGFLGLGMQRLARTEDGRIYRFDLYDYKHTPDWFGPQDWANPERWDKDFW